MKRIACAVLAAGLLAAGPLTGRARAEDQAKKKDGRAEHAERAEKMMKEKLGLTDDQAAKLKAAFEAEKTSVKPLREAQKAATRKLEEQVRGLASDKDIQATLDSLDAGRKAMTAERKKFEEVLASTLKPYQRAKMRLFMAERMRGRMGGRRGMRGGREGWKRGGERGAHESCKQGGERESWKRHDGKNGGDHPGEDRESDQHDDD